jgi:hypothetical protein
MKINKFYRGSATFKCDACGRGTRDTGVQSLGNKLCPQCYELAGIENSISDGHTTLAEERATIDAYMTTVAERGGDVSTWRETFGRAGAPSGGGELRTITLTDRTPVRIRADRWMLIASATGDSYGGGDYARRQQALAQSECDEYAIRVRQHADGRAIVYAVLDAAIGAWGAPAGGKSYRGGEVLGATDDRAAAIRRVGESCQMPDSVIRECIADLPAEEI